MVTCQPDTHTHDDLSTCTTVGTKTVAEHIAKEKITRFALLRVSTAWLVEGQSCFAAVFDSSMH